MTKELVGFDITSKEIKLEGENLVANASFEHVGKIGSLKLDISGKFELIPFINAGIDKLEEIIPGDQKAIAQILKSTIAGIKIKF